MRRRDLLTATAAITLGLLAAPRLHATLTDGHVTFPPHDQSPPTTTGLCAGPHEFEDLPIDDATSYAQLAQTHTPGRDYTVRVTPGDDLATTVLAVHGGRIHPGTGTIAAAVAGTRYCGYEFAGQLTDSRALHLPATRFDEPTCVARQATATRTLSITGCPGPELATYVGGRDTMLGDRVIAELNVAGYPAYRADVPHTALEPGNICNRNRLGSGTQVTITHPQRAQLLTGADCTTRTDAFAGYVAALRSALDTR